MLEMSCINNALGSVKRGALQLPILDRRVYRFLTIVRVAPGLNRLASADRATVGRFSVASVMSNVP
jgi:hypothetical protein